MDAADAALCFGRHATSKLSRIEDLDQLISLGFRGEALASIAAVSEVTLETRPVGQETGTRVRVSGGETLEQDQTGCPEGTRITVENLFYNVPARFKFLRKDSTEAGVVAEMLERLALARPDVSFRLSKDEQEILHTPGNNDLLSAVYALFGRQIAQACLPVDGSSAPLRVHGLAGRPEAARNNRSLQIFFVNGRLVRARAVTAALDEAYKTLLMKSRFAAAVLYLELPANLVDINVHPQKMEVRFWNDGEVFRCVYHAVSQALRQGGAIAEEMAEETTAPAADTVPGPADASAQAPTVYPAAPDLPLVQPPLILSDQAAPENAPAAWADGTLAPAGDPEQSPPPVAAQPMAGEPRRMTIHALADARLVGILFQTYLMLELGDDLLLVDQHAAHEKILFEGLLARRRQHLAGGESPPRQDLLVPALIDVTRREMQLIHDNTALLEQLGFEISPLGPTSVAVRSLPDSGAAELLRPESALRAALEALLQNDLHHEDGVSELFYTMACKAAVKAHDYLSTEAAVALLRDLALLDEPYHCPHGRPVIIRLGRQELEKRFRRIV
jgi:DNA mismatch repair protein MutL